MIHRYAKNGINFLLDVNSGAVHVLDDVAYAVSESIQPEMTAEMPQSLLQELSQYAPAQVEAAYAELYDLKQNGQLFATDDYIDVSKYIPTDAPIKALCLHVAHDCNLRCQYCFAATGDFGTGRKIMPFEVAKNAIDFVIARSKNRRNIEVDFFGGEPLMAFDTVKKTVEYARSIEKQHDKQFRFTITTNGVLLNDEITQYINENMDNVVLSLDGRPSVNDEMRKTVSGGGSYDMIVPKYQKLVQERAAEKDYYARGTFTAKNLDFAEDVLHIAEAGFSSLSVEPVTSEPNSGYDLTEADLPKIFAEYDRLCDIMVERRRTGKPFSFFHFMVDLEQGPCVIKRLRGCGAGYEYIAVTPEGDIYPCHQFVGREEYYQGNVMDKAFDMQIAQKFAQLNIYSREKCKQCWAKFYCSGGCSAANDNMNHDLLEPYELGCELEKKRLECAIYLKAMEKLSQD